MSIRVLVNGALGKMGRLAVTTLEHHADFILVGKTTHEDDLAATIKQSKPDVVIDFTNANSVLHNTQIIIDAHVHPVIGTSGLTQKDIDILKQRAQQSKLGGIIAPNFSLGAVLMMKYAEAIATYFPHVEVIEMHHDGKLDSPSGTAVYTAEKIAKARQTEPSLPKNTRETLPGARGANYQQIPIHSIRLPGLVAHQQIIFGSLGETLSLRHDSIDRQCFMPGMLLACKKVMELQELVYGLEKLL